MEERGNQTVMCSVFFLGIVGYSRKSVPEQILLRDRFNSYLSIAISDVPKIDRIILDSSDGVAINFLGDVEDALKAALSLQESLHSQNPELDQPMQVRMGINLGPVRLVSNINGQPSIVGDGINVAKSVMGFADVGQILVSRPYYDAVSRLSPQYSGMFHYLGSRTDNNVREHEVYSVVYSDSQSIQRDGMDVADQSKSQLDRVVERIKTEMLSATTKLNGMRERLAISFWQAEPQQRAVYVGVAIVSTLLLIVLAVKIYNREDARFIPINIKKEPASLPKAALGGDANMPVQALPGGKEKVDKKPKTSGNLRQKIVENKEPPKSLPKADPIAEQKQKTSPLVSQPKTKSNDISEEKAGAAVSGSTSEAQILVSCREGTEIFVDGVRKGRVSSVSLTLTISPGKHTVIVSHPKAGIFSQEFAIEAGKMMRLSPGFCN